MALILTIDDVLIPESDVSQYPMFKNAMTYNRNLIASTMEVVLDNIDDTYSDISTLGIFFSTNWMDKEVTLYDDVPGVYIWIGRIKNIIIDEGAKTTTVESANYVRELVDTTCVYTASGITPADAIYYILNTIVGISDAYIRLAGFEDASNVQTAESALVNIVFGSDDGKNCMGVVQELLRMSQCDLFTIDNIIHLRQWKPWEGMLGTLLEGNDFIKGAFKTEYEYLIYNGFDIKYNNAGTVASATGTQAGTDGDKIFTIPDEQPEAITSTSFRILYANSTGAAWAGVLVMSRYQYPQKWTEFSLDASRKYLRPGDQVDIIYGNYYHEPIEISEVGYSDSDKSVKIKGLFFNLPVNTIARDVVPPVGVELYEVLPLAGGLFLKWTINLDTDLLGYKIYIAAGEPGAWDEENTNLGQSPIEVKNPSISADGYCYQAVYELTAGATYYAKVTAIDTSYNESVDSNILFATPSPSANNLYCLSGFVYSGLVLDIDNALMGTVPSGYMTYADLDETGYDWDLFITASFQSEELYSESGFSRMQWNSTASTIYIKYAESDDGVTWTWSEEIESWSQSTIDLSGKKYLKYIIIFYSPNWGDTDTIYITSIEEAA